MNRSVYGTPVLTLTEVVEQLMILQGNDRQSHYMAYLMHASRAWKDLLWNTLWSLRQRWVDIDPVTRTLTLPDDMIRQVGISVVDTNGDKQPITHNPNINTLSLSCPAKACSCKTCHGQDTLCEVLDYIQLRTEDVVLGDETLKKRIWNRMDEKGNLLEVTESPAFDGELHEVKYTTMSRAVCALETDEQNCIKATLPNRQKLIDCIGCYLLDCGELLSCERPVNDVAPYRSSYGYWNWDATAKNVIHVKDVRADRVIVTYQSSGECSGEEMLVPEFAVDALQLAMLWRMAMYSPTSSGREQETARGNAARARTRLMQFLNPINMSTFMRLSDGVAKWP